MRQCLYNLKLLYKASEKVIIKNDKSRLSKIFINLFIQRNLNIISKKEQIRDAIIGFDEHKINYNEYIKLKEEKKWIFDHYHKYVPLGSILPEIIFDGDYSKEKIQKVYQQEKKDSKAAEQKNLFILMGNWRNMNQQEFKTIFDTVNFELENGTYLHPGDILHYINIMILFCERELIGETKISLIDKVKKTVSKLKRKIIPINDWSLLNLAYAGWAYNYEIKEVNEMREYIKNMSDENLYILLKATIKEEIKQIKNNVRAFCQNIIHVNGTGKYYGKPYLSLLNIGDFFNALINLPIGDQSLIIASFEERYGITYSNGSLPSEYKKDKDNLLKLLELYNSSLGDVIYNPPEFFKRDISKRLHELVEYFDKQSTSSNMV